MAGIFDILGISPLIRQTMQVAETVKGASTPASLNKETIKEGVKGTKEGPGSIFQQIGNLSTDQLMKIGQGVVAGASEQQREREQVLKAMLARAQVRQNNPSQFMQGGFTPQQVQIPGIFGGLS